MKPHLIFAIMFAVAGCTAPAVADETHAPSESRVQTSPSIALAQNQPEPTTGFTLHDGEPNSRSINAEKTVTTKRGRTLDELILTHACEDGSER